MYLRKLIGCMSCREHISGVSICHTMTNTYSISAHFRQLESEGIDPSIIRNVRSRLALLSERISKTRYTSLTTYRDDSKLAMMFGMHEELDVDQVTDELVMVHELHQNSKYASLCQTQLRQVAEVLHARWPNVPWGVLWKLIIKYGILVVKYDCCTELSDL